MFGIEALQLTSPSPDDSDSSFLSYQPFKDAAVAAAALPAVPQGYTLAFSNLQASSQTKSYLGVKTLNKYDPIQCASYCDQHSGCVAFNLYFERDPSVSPNTDDCPNPASVTNIKCVRWGVWVKEATATNGGEHRGKHFPLPIHKKSNTLSRLFPRRHLRFKRLQQERRSSSTIRLQWPRRTRRRHQRSQ